MIPLVLLGASAIVMLGVLWVVLQPAPAEEMATSKNSRHSPAIADEDDRDLAKQKLRERLIHAGLYKQNSPAFFYMLQIVFISIPVLLCLVAHRFGMLSFQAGMLGGLICGIFGVIAPGLWLDSRKAARQTAIRRSIPDALDVITICVEAGLSLNAAIVRVSKDLANTYPLLATELLIVHRQIQMGKTAGDALRSFAERFDLSELRALASVVAQSERFGASIGGALRVHGETLRTKRMQQAHEKAQKAAVWILLPTVLCIFPALFVVILGPAAYDVAELMRNLQ